MKRVRSLVLLVLSATLLTVITVSKGWAGSNQNPTGVTYDAIPAGDYKIDPGHSVIGFSIRHFEISFVRGRFKEFTGMIRYDAADVTKSTVEFNAKIESIDTGVAGRDTHLRSADFFDAAKYPEMTFKSTRVERRTNNSYMLHGDFTLKGVTKQISFPFTLNGAIKDNRGNTRFGVAAETKINRRDYGITWGGNPMTNGGLNVGNEVMIDLQLEAVKAAPPATQ